MTGLSIGDLSQSFQLRRDNARLKGELERLTGELASGRVSDLRGKVQADYRPLAALERDLAANASYQLASQEAQLFLTTAQAALGAVQDTADDLLSSLLISPSLASSTQIDAVAAQAGLAFESAVSALNVQAAGRSVFAGTQTTGPALAEASVMLDDMAAAVAAAGATDAAGVEAVVDAWFAPAGAFDTVAYLGATAPLQPFRVSPDDDVPFEATASDAPLREVLKGLALSALIDRGVLAGDLGERGTLVARSGERLLSAKDELVGLRGRIGASEEAAEAAIVKLAARQSALEIGRNGIVEADRFRAATELAGVEAQLETLYTVTARLSGLTLSSFLR